MTRPELMTDFFSKRADGYDLHMLNDVEGCREGYEMLPSLIPRTAVRLLDIGCGTGLELDYILAKRELSVLGIDICVAMTDLLKIKHPEVQIINADYFDADFGSGFDVALSFETLHHFKKEEKLLLYKKIYDAISDEGIYIECDYMVDTDKESNRLMQIADEARREYSIPDGTLLHIDTPLSISAERELLLSAGFCDIKELMHIGGTVMLIAKKRAVNNK